MTGITYGKYPFIKVEEAKNYLKISNSNDDARLANLVHYACGVVENYIGFEVLANNYIEYFDGGTTELYTTRAPLISVYELREFDGSFYQPLSPPALDGELTPLDHEGNHEIINRNGVELNTLRRKFGLSSGLFNGSDQYLEINASSDWRFEAENFSIDFQIYPRRKQQFSTNELFTEVSREGIARHADSWNLSRTGSNIYFQISNASLTGAIRPSVWSHVQITRHDTDFFMHINGERTDIVENSDFEIDSEHAILFGYNNHPSGSDFLQYQYFRGQIDELRIRNVAGNIEESFIAPTHKHITDEFTDLLIHFEGSTIEDTHASSADFHVDTDTGKISREVALGGGNYELSLRNRPRFSNYPRGIIVSYRAGYEMEDVPYDLKMATMDYLRIIYRLEQNKTGYSFQGENVDFIPDAHGIPPYIRAILNLYRNY